MSSKSAKQRKGSAIHRAIAHHGANNFEREELESGFPDQEAMDLAETKWVVTLKTRTHQHGYNIREGGHGGGPHSRETRLKMSASVSPEERERRSIRMKARRADTAKEQELLAHLRASFNSPAGKARRSAQMRQQWRNPVYRTKMVALKIGRSPSAETIRKIKESALREETRSASSERTRRRWAETDLRQRVRAACLGRPRSQETKDRMSRTIRANRLALVMSQR
jgi:hypothetical protein